MKSILSILFSMTAFSAACNAARYDLDVGLGDIRVYDKESTLNSTWSGYGFVRLPTISETPNCSKYNGKYVVTFSTDKAEILSTLLAAKMASRTVTITFDDTVYSPTGSYCKLQFLTIK